MSTGTQRPNQLLSNPYCANRNVSCWLNAAAFQAPANGTLGDLGVNTLASPGYFDVDVALSRRFAFKERQYVEIRAEAFNIQNLVNFLSPVAAGLSGGTAGNALNSSSFGRIQADVSPRVMQFAVKYVF